MTPPLASATPPGPLHRIGRGLDAWAWADWAFAGVASHGGRFADVGRSDSIAHLRAQLAPLVLHHGLDDLDSAALRLRVPRAFTQGVSRYVFERGVDADGGSLAGIRYLSRLGDDFENWANFEGTAPVDAVSGAIAADDPDLAAALDLLGLTLSGA
jgi:hypothetical protein